MNNEAMQDVTHQHIPDISELLRQINKDGEKKSTITNLVQASEALKTSNSEERFDIIFDEIMSGKIFGDPDDFHNISIDFSRNDQHTRAMKICQKGIEIWPTNIDLNADAVSYALDSGDFAAAAEQVRILNMNCPDRSKWNWRGFSFLFDYYNQIRPDGYEIQAEQLVRDYKTILPFEERAYMCEARLLLSTGRYDDAINSLENAISERNAPQCALKLSDLYFERAQYEDVIRTATLGIAYAAEPQASIRVGYLLFLRALSKDALYLRKGIISQDEVRQIIQEYKLAKRYIMPSEQRIVDQRIDILSTYSMLDNNVD